MTLRTLLIAGACLLPPAAMAGGTSSAISTGVIQNSSGGYAVSAATAGGAAEATASGPFGMTATIETASTMTGTVLPGGHFSGSQHSVSVSTINGHTQVLSQGWTQP